MDSFIQFEEHGGPEVLRVRPVELGPLKQGEVRIQQHAVGVNFIDMYYRKGLYPTELPSGLGVEGAGRVIACGPGVVDFKVGDRVAYCGGPLGGYADVRDINAEFAQRDLL